MTCIGIGTAMIPLILVLVGLTGCTGGAAAIPPVNVNINRVVDQMLADYDTDKNGALSRAELEAQPALAACLVRCKPNQGNEISVEQLKKVLQVVFDPHTALVSATCLVRRNGQPFAGAEVKLVPLPALKDVLPTGSGVSDSFGATTISPPPEALPSEAPPVPGLMPPGFYLMEVTHPTVKIPEKYNSKTVLGKEVSGETSYRGALAVDLKM
jgi:hypothetical protein